MHVENLWAVSGRSYRQIAERSDLIEGETLVEGEPPVFPPDTVAEAETQRAQLFVLANAAIAPLQDASDLGIATEAETAALLAWKKYRVLLNRVDTSATDITWPEQPTA